MLTVDRFEGPASEWDDFAARQRGATHFHRLGWREVIGGSLGHECLYFAARTPDGALAGILPLVRVRSLVFGHYLVSMPFLNYGGPLGSDAAIQALSAEATERARADGAKLLELRSRITLPVDLPVSHRKITVVLDLPANRDALWKGFSAKLRSQARKPEKEGVTVRFGADQVEPFYQVFAHHMRDLGTPVLPLKWFEAIASQFPDDAWFACAWYQGKPVAGGAGFRWADEVEISWASSLREHNRIAPNMMLYSAFMERAISEGLARFNFGRCSPGSGTHRFKQQWGAKDEALYWYQRASGGDGKAATPSPDHGLLSLGPRVWRHLPLGVTTWLGPRIVRFIP